MAAGETVEKTIATLRSVLQLSPATILDADTRLLGGIPEFDSLAVASVLLALEEQFDVEFVEEDISAEMFATVGTLCDYIEGLAVGNDSQPAPLAGFVPARSGQLFVLRRQPVAPAERCVLFVPPFGEEMNRARPLMAATAETLSAHGLACCYFDLHGTGDSDGEFVDARWTTWLDDLHSVKEFLVAAGHTRIDLIGVRLGALLALHYAAGNDVGRLVLWDPVLDAGSYLDRFLLTRSMAAMMSGQNESVAMLRQRLENGEAVEVGGYALHPQLARELAALQVPGSTRSQSVGLVSRSSTAGEIARAAGLVPDEVGVADYQPYWSAVEAVAAPGLVRETCRQLGVA